MKPIDFRNETFHQLKDRLEGDRLRVYQAWIKHGPGTTREVAQRSGIDILSFRPRTTELYQMGALEVLNDSGAEGVYEAQLDSIWQRWYEQKRAEAVSRQLNLI